MIEPNRLSNPGEDAARARVEALVCRLDEIRIEQIGLSHAAAPAPDVHARLVARVEAAADRCGRRALLDDVRAQSRVTLAKRFSPLSVRTGFGFPSPINAVARPEDEARIIMAVVDALAVAVVEDVLDPETASRLADPGRQLLGLAPLGDPGDAPAATAIPEPSADDWAEAAAAIAVTGGEKPAVGPARIVLAVILACIFVPIGAFAGFAGGSTAVGILAGLAVAALCWQLATYRG